MTTFLGRVAQLTCRHVWTRHRTEDGQYTLRCCECGKLHQRTWEAVIGSAPKSSPKVLSGIERMEAEVPTI